MALATRPARIPVRRRRAQTGERGSFGARIPHTCAGPWPRSQSGRSELRSESLQSLRTLSGGESVPAGRQAMAGFPAYAPCRSRGTSNRQPPGRLLKKSDSTASHHTHSPPTNFTQLLPGPRRLVVHRRLRRWSRRATSTDGLAGPARSRLPGVRPQPPLPAQVMNPHSATPRFVGRDAPPAVLNRAYIIVPAASRALGDQVSLALRDTSANVGRP